MTESATDRTTALTAPEKPGTRPPGRTRGGRLTLREFTRNRLAVLGGGIIVFFVLFCFVGPHLYVTEQISVDPVNSMLPPGGGHPLGTDAQGFDVLGRIMKGGQASLQIGLLAALIATAIGTLYGTVAGLAGGLADAVMMRVVDTLLSIPFLFIVLIIATRFSSTVLSLSLTLGAFSWLAPARLVRAEVLALRSRGFVAAATVMGATKARIIVRHLIPNALGVVIVNITFQVADAIIAVSLLGFLGFGLNYPAVEWGTQLSKGVSSLLDGSWWLIYPVGGCLVLVVMAFNFVGDALRDSIDVRLRRR
ncbi:ABC transporter permease [Actinomadura opuntiae]|uniref:ABC transporter permease n=1 Tax=Actinomadura sp. OS1-43 TaxID=604315 RepID=UPI00255ACDD1|nr:ABC transporter permease [Actinomadura sp. OS1-43]MDL4817442.1 ABC transporter permease [Actinomadura sp. OS1-43]